MSAATLDELVWKHELEQIDLLMMNIEGAERSAIKGMQKSISITLRVAIACHDFRAERDGLDDMRTKALVVDYLRRNGFRVVTPMSCGAGAASDWVFGENLAFGERSATNFQSAWPFAMILGLAADSELRILEPVV